MLHCFFAYAFINPVRTSLLLGLQYVMGCFALVQRQEESKRVPCGTEGSCSRWDRLSAGWRPRPAPRGGSGGSLQTADTLRQSTPLASHHFKTRSGVEDLTGSVPLSLGASVFGSPNFPLSARHCLRNTANMGTPCW